MVVGLKTTMVVGLTTTYAISAYHHWWCEFESRSGWGVQHYVIMFVRDDLLVTEILLKVALNTIKLNQTIDIFLQLNSLDLFPYRVNLYKCFIW